MMQSPAQSYLHSMFSLHRNLQTSNLLLRIDGALKICDFVAVRLLALPAGQ